MAQLSPVAIGAIVFTTPGHTILTFPGQVIVGLIASITDSLKKQLSTLLFASVTYNQTVSIPAGIIVPEIGLWVTTSPPHPTE